MQQSLSENYLVLITLILALTLFLAIYMVIKLLKSKRTPEILEEKEPKIEISKEKILKIKEKGKIDRKKRELIKHHKIKKDDFTIFKNIKVLVAEDNIINQKVITSIFLDSGIDMTIANNGEEVLSILEKESDFSMIFMDVHMPIIDGFETTKRIRENKKYNNIPIIALSGEVATDNIKKMFSAGMEAHLEKPLKMDALYDTLYAYTTGEEVQNSSIKFNTKTAEIDINKGLEICLGDRDFYLEILNDFVSKYSDSAEIIKSYLSAADSKGADKILLDILGIAANIGATNLYKVAVDLKQSIANPADMEYINNLKQYERSLYRACEAIKEYNAMQSTSV